ncbi:MAG: terminase small subunit, partial [Candidatus Omnitrophica bacterium]|nr:terminase small subunit [Candidatus Omnitrophota bacterium]
MLTRKKQAFIHHYLTDAYYNGAKACRMAGYQVTNQDRIACNLLEQVEVNEVIEKELAKLQLSNEDIIREIGNVIHNPKKESNKIRALELLARIHGLMKDT